MFKKQRSLLLISLFVLVSISFVSANNYTVDIYFTIPDSVYFANERIELKGFVYQANYTINGTLVSASAVVANANVNLTIRNVSGTQMSNYTLTTDSNGTFYSRSNFYGNGTEINTSTSAGVYYIKAKYKDPSNVTWFSEVGISVINRTIDIIRINSKKANYYPSEIVDIEVEAIKLIGDRILYTSNVSINGSLRNSSKSIISSFSCVTGVNGKCSLNVTAPSTYGYYILELDNFKAFSSFYVIPFSFNIYMKDNLGKTYKNVYALNEQARVEVQIINATSTDTYTFSGYIADSSGNVVRLINSTILNNNNSFINSFLFTVDSIAFGYAAYTASVTVTRTGGGSITSSTLFKVKDWDLSVYKKTSNSGFEYEHSIFPNKTMRFEAYPTYRSNGSILKNLSASYFSVTLKDNLENIINVTNATWNASCGKDGCYEFSLSSAPSSGKYTLYTTLSYSRTVETKNKVINVIDNVMSVQSTNQDGALKELFGTNEYVYLSFASYNLTSSSSNLSNAEVFLISFMNRTEFNYTEVSNFLSVNASDSNYEWAWNSTLQRIKLDVPKIGGVYNVFIFGNNRTIGALTKFIVNPYDACSVPKDTPGEVTGGYYYVWQFKTTDTIYFEIKLTQANNPLGRATASNSSNGTSSGNYGMGSACAIDTTTQQVVNNATVTVDEVKNTETGSLQNINLTDSTCQARDTSGGYTCTVKPLSKWSSGGNVVKFNVRSQDGTTDIIYSRFEARAFYLYGWSQTWQNSPSSNITLNIQLYEAGSGWWGRSSEGGLSGTATLKKIEYQGRDGEWLWPPVDSGYNASALNSSTVTSGSGSISIPVSYALGRNWKTGYYRAVIQATTSSGDTDYGYAWFGIKLWDVYGQPVECDSSSCKYKNYFNSKDNITLYIKISKAEGYSYNYQGGGNIYGNVTVGIKKIQDCRTWPCKELNSSQYNASTITVNESSPWYWNANTNNQSRYIIQINTSTGRWGTGWYSVVLDVNGTDTGYSWFNTIAFYVSTRPTDKNGTNYKYSIKPSEIMYFNITTVKSYKGWDQNYNDTDYVNVTLDDATLRTWNQTTWKLIEYNYPEDINITPTFVNRSSILNVTFNRGNWPSSYYYGEIIFKNSDNETSTGWLWFDVKPFRVGTTTSNYNIDHDKCVNATLDIFEPSWYSNIYSYGNYSIISVYEDVWSTGSRSTITYTNYTSGSFNATANITVCPNNNTGNWGRGSWGGYHYLNIVVKDNLLNDTQNGWLYFKAVPFRVTWGSISGGTNKLINQAVVVAANITKYSTGASTTGNLTKIYQWRYDDFWKGKEQYVFSVGNCFSNVSRQCTVNGTQNVTIYAPSYGWKVGYNYLYSEWTKDDDSSLGVDTESGIYIEGREAYNGYYYNRDLNDNYKYFFNETENITIKLYVRNSTYDSVNVNITSVQYAYSGDSCWSEWCRSYVSATWSNSTGGTRTTNGAAILNIQVLSSNWTRGYYYIKATVSGTDGTSTITGGMVRIKNMIAPNGTMASPSINQTINGSTFLINITTTENSNCYITIVNYDTLYCSGWDSYNSTNSSLTPGFTDSCNATKYNFNGSTYYRESVFKDYHSVETSSNYWYSYASTGMVTDGTVHGYIFNTTNKITGSSLTAQDYGILATCYDDDSNHISFYSAIKINVTQNISSSNFTVTINSPRNTSYKNNNITFNFTINVNGTCLYTLNNGATNNSMSTTDNKNFNATNLSMADSVYLVYAYCNDTSGNVNYTKNANFTVDTTPPKVTIVNPTNTNYSSASVNLNYTISETNPDKCWYYNGTVNSSSQVCGTNWTGITANEGSNTWTVYINDTADNLNSTNVTFVIDTINPLISYGAGTPANGSNLSQNWVYVNVSVTETNFGNITFNLYNRTGERVNSTTFTSATYTINWTNLPYRLYDFNVTIFDIVGNSNTTVTRYLNLTT